MKIKYYLRGLGVGIILSTILLSFTMGKSSKNELSDEQIIERATQLGMTMKNSGVTIDRDAIDESIRDSNDENNSSSDEDEKENQPALDGENSKKEDSKEQSNADKNGGNNEKETSEKKDLSNKKNEDLLPDDKKSNKTEGEGSGDSKNDSKEEVKEEKPIKQTVKIRSGMTATQVSRLLESEGIISSATAFNKYLRENNLTEKIVCGEYSIPVNADYKEIVNLIVEK